MGKFIDFSGQRFGRLTVMKRGENRGKATRWECLCDCGNKTLTEPFALKSGATVSCGCYQKEAVSKSSFKHGHSRRSTTYGTWVGMVHRCAKPSHHKFASYGGAGITVCERWLSFSNFLEDMGERPDGHTIDRIDGTLGYFKENCRWATINQQQRNIKSNRMVTHNGETRCATEWAEIIGVHKNTFIQRLNNGLTGEALFSPPMNRGRGSESHKAKTVHSLRIAAGGFERI